MNLKTKLHRKLGKSRKVVLKLEWPVDLLLFIPIFIVTTLEDLPKDTVQYYAKRGTMETISKKVNWT